MIAAVVDCSALVDLLSRAGAAGITSNEHLQYCLLAAPQLIEPEIVNVARRLAGRHGFDTDVAERLLREYRDVDLMRFTHENLSEFAWRVRDNISPYDAMYVALARHLEIPLITSDASLARAAEPWCTVLEVNDLLQS